MKVRRIRRRIYARMQADVELRQQRRYWVHVKVYARTHMLPLDTASIGAFTSCRLVTS